MVRADQITAAQGGARKAESRDRILDVASSLMAERGYPGTSIGAICREVDLAPTAIYWHFGSKEGLLGAVIERALDSWYAELDQAVSRMGGHFESFAAVMADTYRNRPEPLRLLLRMGLDRHHTEPDVHETVQRMRARALDLLAGAIARAVPLGTGEVPGDVHKVLARHLLIQLDGIFLVGAIDDREDLFEELFEMMGTSVLAVGQRLLTQAGRGDSSASSLDLEAPIVHRPEVPTASVQPEDGAP